MDDSKKLELRRKEQELATLEAKANFLLDTMYDISFHDSDSLQKIQKYREEIDKVNTAIDLIRDEIFLLRKNQICSNEKINLYFDYDSIERGYGEVIVVLHGTSTIIGSVRLNRENDDVFGNISYGLNKEYRGHHFMLQSLELLKDTMLKMKIVKPIITVEPNNLSSVKTIQSFGGVLVQEHNDKEVYYDTYEVDLLEKEEKKRK